MQTHLSHSPLAQKLEELREYIRREIQKEYKIKEGAENLRKVAKDKKSVSDVNVIVKKSNSKLTELKQELQELESQILVSQGNTMTPGMFSIYTIYPFGQTIKAVYFYGTEGLKEKFCIVIILQEHRYHLVLMKNPKACQLSINEF